MMHFNILGMYVPNVRNVCMIRYTEIKSINENLSKHTSFTVNKLMFEDSINYQYLSDVRYTCLSCALGDRNEFSLPIVQKRPIQNMYM